MMQLISKKTHGARRGFTLIELAIVLAVASLLFAGLWRLMASGNTQLRDQAAADQQRQLISAAQAYLATTEAQEWMAKKGKNEAFDLPLPATNDTVDACRGSLGSNSGFCDYLPLGFTTLTTNSYGQTFAIRVLKDDQPVDTRPHSYSFMILTSGGDVIPDTSGGRIASLIGNDGGFVYTADVCGVGNACGAFGSWVVSPTGVYKFSSAEGGHVASRTYAGMNTAQNVPWLARLDVPNDPVLESGSHDYNTIQTSVSLGDQIMYGTGTADGLVYGGKIVNLGQMVLGRSTNKGDISLILNGVCTRTDIHDTSCDPLVQVNGDQIVTGLLTANKLYASEFIYDTKTGADAEAIDTSDIRLKHDIVPISDALGRLSQMKGYMFSMNGSDKKKYGVLAQEVEKVFPELIHEMTDGYKAVDYMGLIGPLVAAMDEMRAENIKLHADMDELKQEVLALTKQVNAKSAPAPAKSRVRK